MTHQNSENRTAADRPVPSLNATRLWAVIQRNRLATLALIGGLAYAAAAPHFGWPL